MSEKKPETPIRKARRKYEVLNKEYRDQATKQFNTRISREMYEEICTFLKEHHITKVDLIFAGYEALRNQYGPKEEKNKE